MKPITNILPTIEADDIWYFLKTLFFSKQFYKRCVIKKLNEHFPNSHIFLFNSGRDALSFLAANTLQKKSEVLLQAFTCSAVVYPFLTHDIVPQYLDIDKQTLNINYDGLQTKVNKNSKALIVQYTFGLLPKKLEEIFSLAKKHKLFIIEDLAHSFGNTYKNKLLGNFGDAAVLSFGRDKVVSSVSGGALIVHNNMLVEKLKTAYEKLHPPSFLKTFRLSFYLFFMTLAKRFYFLKLTRITIFVFQLIGLLEKAVSKREKQGKKAKHVQKISPLFLPLLHHQLNKLEKLQAKRRANTLFYNRLYKNNYLGALLKYPLFINEPKKTVLERRRHLEYLDTWYSNIIDPVGVNLKRYCYQAGSCPIAEEIGKQIINLPTLFRIDRKMVNK